MSSGARPVVFVTGASAGIGEACVRAFADAGWDAALAARRVERLDALSKELSAKHAGAQFFSVACDVTDDASVARALEAAGKRFGRLDALVNNAGFGVYGTVADTPLSHFRENMEVNYFGVLRCTQAALPLLRAAAKAPRGGKPAVVMLSSIVGKRAFPGSAAYSASKFALEGLSEALRVEVANDGITVSVINPGVTKTEFFDVVKGERPAGYRPPENGMPAEAVARVVLNAVRRPRRNVYLTRDGRLAVLLQWLSPRTLDFFVKRMWGRKKR
ncbi:MAG: SDR family NAD(P)-dependent oxidoreductase [Planctomycetes bacterium]|nr:SDR family NAD(P)-dependent oxidoreductase [Planctomycetota bacterium]